MATDILWEELSVWICRESVFAAWNLPNVGARMMGIGEVKVKSTDNCAGDANNPSFKFSHILRTDGPVDGNGKSMRF